MNRTQGPWDVSSEEEEEHKMNPEGDTGFHDPNAGGGASLGAEVSSALAVSGLV